jgi:cohesin loading factor subunit SCC2
LAGIVEADPRCLSESEIEVAVKNRLMDMAITVREASIELLGKFVVHQPDIS